jgi:hypothetical protein
VVWPYRMRVAVNSCAACAILTRLYVEAGDGLIDLKQVEEPTSSAAQEVASVLLRRAVAQRIQARQKLVRHRSEHGWRPKD